MKIATDEQHRILAFVDACNRSGHLPSLDDVREWVRRPVARGAVVEPLFAGLLAVGQAMARISAGTTVREAEDSVTHLCELRWLRVEGANLRITPLGAALLTAAERSDELTADAMVVVLGNDDPVAYPRLIAHLASLGPGLLVDPYFRVDHLMHILDGTKIDRVLVSKQHRESKEIRAALSLAVTSDALPRPVQIRASAEGAIHDRMFVADSGPVHTLGASINSVALGTVTTVMSPVPEPAASTLRLAVSEWWAAADVLGGPATVGPSGSTDEATAAAPRKPAKGRPKKG